MLMDNNAPKRRRTSHNTSLRISGSTTPSPQKPRREPTRSTPRRKSFQSPTKASLARFNPELLARPPQSTRSSSGRLIERTNGPTRRSLPFSPPRSSLSGESQRGTEIGGLIARPSTVNDDTPRQAVLQERTPDPSVEAEQSQESTRVLDTEEPDVPSQLQSQMTSRRLFVSAASQRVAPVAKMVASSPSKAITIHFPTNNKVNPVTPRRSTRLSGGKSQDALPQENDLVDEEGEPDLPPTPRERGLDNPITPTGLPQAANSTPRRKRSVGQKPSSSTPARRSIAAEKAELKPRENEDEASKLDREDGTIADDVGMKEELKKQLLSELRQLEEEVVSLENELARTESERRPLREKPPDRQDVNKSILFPQNSNGQAVTPCTFTVQGSQMSWGSFLPFAKRRKPAATVSVLPIPDGPLPSHYPIELENPLPYLQVFTPLNFTSTSKLFPSSATVMNSAGAQQQHVITATSPEQLLRASLALTVDTTSHTIIALSIASLSTWAEHELGKWIRSRAESSNVAGKDISSICWAIGRYWELAEKRAKYMIKCEESYPELAFSGQQTFPGMGRDHGAEEMEDVDDHERVVASSRRKVLRHLGRSSLTFRRQDVQLLIAWDISFDWTGEAQSQVTAVASMPDTWTRADSRGSLSKISKLFRDLVAEKGMYGATKIILGLLFPE